MRFTDYLKDKIVWLLLNLAGVALMLLYLIIVGNRLPTLLVIFVLWFSSFFLYFLLDYRNRNRYFKQIFQQLTALDQPYLIAECMEHSWRREDQAYREVIRRSNKAVIERIHTLEAAQKEYREFIEGWIHEVKRPLTGLALLSERLDRPARARLLTDVNDVEQQVNQALFYARSDSVYQDYLIKEVTLAPLIRELLKKNRYLMQERGLGARVECGEVTVFSDGLWLTFILEQILLNAIKYRADDPPGGARVVFAAREQEGCVTLSVRDNGRGIPDHEIGRIFDKGFTGSNGRSGAKATGIGLYLCRKLSHKLGLEISARSRVGAGTTLILTFPKHAFLSKL